MHFRILRERSHGVPAWCLEILKDILDKKQLIVVLDDGRPEFRQSAVVPNTLLVKPVKSRSLSVPSETTIEPVLRVSVTEVSLPVLHHSAVFTTPLPPRFRRNW